MEIGKLAAYAEKLDTFEGAATAAQGLNAVLGDSLISVTDLVHADFPDKITMIQDAMGAAGIEFDDADRRMKQVIANAAGFDNVGEASKFFTNKDAAEEAMGVLETDAEAQEDLKIRITEGMTAAEKATATLSSFAGGVSTFNQKIQKSAKNASGIMAGTLGTILKNTKSSEAAFITTLGSVEALNTGLAKTGAIMGGAFSADKLKKYLMASPGAAAATAALSAPVGAEVYEGATGGGSAVDDMIKTMNDLLTQLQTTQVPIEIPVELNGDALGAAMKDLGFINQNDPPE